MFDSKGPRFHGNIWKSIVVSSVSIVAGEDARQCMSEKEIHFLPPRWMAPIERTGFGFVRHNWISNSSWLKPNRSTTTELLRRVFCEYSWSPPHYPAVENDHFAKERMVLERHLFHWVIGDSWREKIKSDLQIQVGNFRPFRREYHSKCEKSTKGRVSFHPTENHCCCILHTCNLYPSNVFYPSGIFLAKWEPVFLFKKDCLRHFRALKPLKRETNMVKTTRATLQHSRSTNPPWSTLSLVGLQLHESVGNKPVFPAKPPGESANSCGPDRGVANHNPCFPKIVANICSSSHEMSHVCK